MSFVIKQNWNRGCTKGDEEDLDKLRRKSTSMERSSKQKKNYANNTYFSASKIEKYKPAFVQKNGSFWDLYF